MKKIVRVLASLLALILAMSGMATTALADAVTQTAQPPLTLEAIDKLNGGAAKVYTRDDRVTFVDGTCTDGPVTSMTDAASVVSAMIPLMGGDARTRFEPWRTLTDTSGNRYYVFQQMYAGVTVSGGAVKVVTDRDGRMLGLVCSVETELPEAGTTEGITAEQAEALVIAHAQEAQNQTLEVLEGHTDKIVLPVNLEIDMESEEEKEESRFVWVVYTNNPSARLSRGSELPYLAHYVDLGGEYLYSLPTVIPGDEAGASGYNAAYVFEFMEPVDYTGTVTLADGSEREISLQLMRDSRTGMVYLGNLERRIAVADCYEFLYNKGRVVLEASRDNTGWDENCLMALYNYCRAYDYYKEIGWMGSDGLDTPILILKDFCDKDHKPIDNAAYAGKYYGWQLFLSSSANDFSQCLDVLAHEFTHCVTGSVMTYNAYMNDYGAINEAMSDIQGNICDLMYLDEGEAEDPDWLVGEDIDAAIRSMSDPHRYQQPEYTWDLHYVSEVKSPTELNDRGGVHGNSSLLNYLAWQLCAKGGMTLEEARAYWFAVDCSMVPGTDYPQLAELMPWVLKNLGLAKYENALTAATDATRLRVEEMPEAFDEDRALLTLTLPDTEQFTDGNWALGIFSVNVNGLLQRAIDIIDGAPGYENAMDELAHAIDPEAAATGDDVMKMIDDMINAFFEETEVSEIEENPENADESGPVTPQSITDSDLVKWLRQYFGDLFFSGLGAAGQDGRTVSMVCRPGLTVPVLLRLEFKPNSMQLKTSGLAVYIGHWIDLGGVVSDLVERIDSGADLLGESGDDLSDEMPDELSGLLDMLNAYVDSDEAEEEAEVPEETMESLTLEEVRAMLVDIRDNVNSFSWLLRMFFYEIKPGKICVLRPDGLEQVMVLDEEHTPDLFGMIEEMEETETK